MVTPNRIAAVVAVVILPALGLFMVTRALLYHPTRTPLKPLERLGWKLESAPVAPDVTLQGVVRPAADPQAPWLVFFGGNAMGLDSGQAILTIVAGDEPWGLACFAYRGYDGSDGSPNQPGILADAEKLPTLLENRFGVAPEQLVLLGQSLGSGVASHVAARLSREGSHPRGLVLLSPYTSIAQVFDDHVPLLPIKWLVRDPYRTDELLSDLKGPVLLIHGTGDTLIGFEHSRELASRLGPRGKLVPLEGLGHNDLWEARETTLAIREFVGNGAPQESVD